MDGSGTVLRPLRRRLYLILDGGARGDRLAQVFEGTIVALILANVLAFALETVPSIAAEHGPALELFNTVSVLIFTVEYGLRLWVCTEHPLYGEMPPGRARIAHALTPFMVIDFLAIAPFFISQFVAVDLRLLRMFRLLRFLKMVRYSPALLTIVGVLASEWRALAGTGVVMSVMLLGAAALLYIIEGQVQPDGFGTVPHAMWWAMATLTTVGYGDVVPVTALGKFIGAIVMLLGYALFALPVGIIATGFSQQIHRRDFMVNWSLVAHMPLFADLGSKDLATVLELVRARVVTKNTIIAHEGEAADGLYIVSSGEIEVINDEGALHYRQGDWFGAGSLFGPERRSETITALTKCHLLHIDRDAFQALVSRFPDLAARLMDSLAEQGMDLGDLAAVERRRGREHGDD